METSAAFSLEKTPAYRAILWGGLIAGTMDILAACINTTLRGGSALKVLQSIASGWLGADAYKLGFKAAALGLVSHFFIATVATAVYYAASRKLDLLVRRAWWCGPAYGIAVYLFMNFVVFPLSAVPFRFTFRPGPVITAVLIHIFCVGLPIALTVRRFSR
jgi:hypothetical protein